MTSENNREPLLSHAPRSYACHFIALFELKLNLSSGNASIGAKLPIFSLCVTLKFDDGPQNRKPGKNWKHIYFETSYAVHCTI